MQAFHFDFNTAHFKPEYIKKRLDILRLSGYDTILWEMEDAVRFSCQPEIAAEDSFSQEEWNEILHYGTQKGFKHIPLLQCAGHVEYILRHKQNRHLAENDSGYCYCLSNPELPDFLKKMLQEVRQMFPDAEYFHIGCDETRMLGTCPKCSAAADRLGKAQFLLQHIVNIHDFLKAAGVKTAIWADLAVSHPEVLPHLPEDILLFDWHYDLHRDSSRIYIPGAKDLVQTNNTWSATENIPAEYIPSLFPEGSSRPDPFYFSRYLTERNIQTAVCSSTSCSGENDFCGNALQRIKNVFDSASAGCRAAGTLVTSWTQHLFPYELQDAAIAACPAAVSGEYRNAEAFLAEYGQKHFGSETAGKIFPEVIKDLSSNCLFADTKGMGHSKFRKVPRKDHYSAVIARMDEDCLDRNIQQADQALSAYFRAGRNLAVIRETATAALDELDIWILAARNLQLRARFALLMLYRTGHREQVFTGKIIQDFIVLREQTSKMYKDKLTEKCLQRFLFILFDLPLTTLQNLEKDIFFPE